MSEGTAETDSACCRSVGLLGRTKSEPARRLPKRSSRKGRAVWPACTARPKRDDLTEASAARVHGSGGQLVKRQREPSKRASGTRAKRKQRCMLAERLTFELSWHQRWDARARLARMYRVPPTWPAWPAVGAQLERGVRPHLLPRPHVPVQQAPPMHLLRVQSRPATSSRHR